MSASDPTKKNQKVQGVSKSVLVVDYLPTQATLDTLDYVLPFQESLSETPEYDKDSQGPYTSKTSDMFRYHTRRYFRDFPSSLKKEAPNYSVGPRFFNPSVFPAPIIDPQGDFKIGDEGTFPDNIIWVETKTDPKYMFYDSRTPDGNSKATWLNIRGGLNNKKNPNYSPLWAFLSGYVLKNPGNADNLLSQLTKIQSIVLVYDKFGENVPGFGGGGYTIDERNINTYSDFEKFVRGFSSDTDSVRVGSLNLDKTMGVYHLDHTCDYDFPLSKGEMEKAQIPVKTLYASLGEEYNFYVNSYEKVLADYESWKTSDLEPIMPNIYVMAGSNASAKKLDELNLSYKRTLTLFGSTESSPWIPKKLKNLTNSGDRIDFGQYFSNWGSAVTTNKLTILGNSMSPGKNLGRLYRQNRNIIVPPSEAKNIVEYSKLKTLFPLYTEIEFSTDTNSKLAEPLIKSNMWTSLLSYLIRINDEASFSDNESTGAPGETLYGVKTSSLLFKGYTQQNVVSKESDTYNTKMQQISTNEFDKFSVKSIDVLDWLERSSKPGKFFANKTTSKIKWTNKKYTILDPDSNKENTLSTYNKNPIMEKIMQAGFKAKLKKLIKENMRSYAGVITGAKCYNETLFYKIEKRNAASGKVIQNIWFVNNPEIDVINYVDTQVMYNKDYDYKIFSWQLVIGNKYNYAPPTMGSSLPDSGLSDSPATPGSVAVESGFDKFVGELDSENEFAAMFDVLNMPSIKLMEMPYYEPATIKVLDDPPVPPGATLVPYRAVSDRVLITLSQETGEYLFDPIHLNSDEFQKIEEYRKAKGYESDEKILYRSDDSFGNFEIFRTTKRPVSYSNFSDSKIIDLAPGRDTFIDNNILPNTKHYYMFRVIDRHGHISNPSHIYEFELVKNLESVYPITNVLYMEDLEKEEISKSKTPKKSFRKYLRITPAETQISLNYNGLEGDMSDADSATELMPNIGFEENGLIGKKFKIRLTSKQTGRQMDFNLSFKASWDGNKIVKFNED